MIRKYGSSAAPLVILGAALALRLPNLGNRLFHGDEAVHAVKVQELRDTGIYKYDPNEYHGPTLYYADLPILALSGHRTFAQTTESDYRLAPALIGALMVLLVWLLRDGIGPRAALIAGLFLAVSPAFVFYSRYFIQEIFLAFFTLAMIACGWRYSRSGKIGWLISCGASAGAMIATKETAPIAFLAMAVACIAVRDKSKMLLAKPEPLVIGATVAVGVAYVLLSGFFTNPLGPLGYFRTYAPWLGRTGSTGLHNHSFFYYFNLLTHFPAKDFNVSSELLLPLFAVIGAYGALRRLVKCDFTLAGFLSIFTLVLTGIYCLIPYKTPWCMLSFLTGMALMAAIGIDYLWAARDNLVRKFEVVTLVCASGTVLIIQASAMSFRYQNDPVNPFVYAAPVREVQELAQKIADVARQSPQKDATLIKLISVDAYYWPLPWYLRRFVNVGYYVGMPADPVAPIVIASPEFEDELDKHIKSTHTMTRHYGLRPGIAMQLWVKDDLWGAYVKSLETRKVQIGE